MAVVQTVVHDDLLAAEVGVAEGGRDIDDGARLEALGLLRRDKALQQGHGVGEEGRVARADQDGAVAIGVAAGIEGHDDELLGLEPLVGLLLALVKVIAVDVLEARLVGRLVVADAHAVRVTAAHIILRIVDDDAVLGAHNGRLADQAAVRHVIDHVELAQMAGTEHGLVQLLLAQRHRDALTLLEHLSQLGRPGEFL